MNMFSVITPSFNRANTLFRVFNSLQAQTYKNFEWIIIDDGSKDNTADVVKEFINEANFPISYKYQENSGKHIALNTGVSLAHGEFIVILDSDDECVPETLETFLNEWESIDEKKRNEFKGVTARCYNPVTMKAIGREFPSEFKEANNLDVVFKYKFGFEKWGFIRTDLMREFPFPDIDGLNFLPEAIVWDSMARKYKEKYINNCLRGYYKDQVNAITNKSTNRSKARYYLWKHYINDLSDYLIYDPLRFLKAFIGITMDGLASRKSIVEIVKEGNGFGKKIIILLFSPVGGLLYFINR